MKQKDLELLEATGLNVVVIDETTVFPNDVDHAQALVDQCQLDLQRELTNGERRDLLADNTKWTTDYIRRVVGELRR